MNSRNRVVGTLTLVTAMLLAACSSTPVAPPVVSKATPPVSTSTAPAINQSANTPVVPSVLVPAPLPPYLDPKNALYKDRSVYFDFDQSTIKPEAAPLIEAHGKFLSTHPEVSIKIQGNTDEQGGAEYNLALGQKRADAVVKALKFFGVKDAQMEAVSFGKEKPRALGNDEAAFAQNRRADLAYPDK